MDAHDVVQFMQTTSEYETRVQSRQQQLNTRLLDLEGQRKIFIAYLHIKIREEDWHGVADIAMDLRELDAETKGLRHP